MAYSCLVGFHSPFRALDVDGLTEIWHLIPEQDRACVKVFGFGEGGLGSRHVGF